MSSNNFYSNEVISKEFLTGDSKTSPLFQKESVQIICDDTNNNIYKYFIPFLFIISYLCCKIALNKLFPPKITYKNKEILFRKEIIKAISSKNAFQFRKWMFNIYTISKNNTNYTMLLNNTLIQINYFISVESINENEQINFLRNEIEYIEKILLNESEVLNINEYNELIKLYFNINIIDKPITFLDEIYKKHQGNIPFSTFSLFFESHLIKEDNFIKVFLLFKQNNKYNKYQFSNDSLKSELIVKLTPFMTKRSPFCSYLNISDEIRSIYESFDKKYSITKYIFMHNILIDIYFHKEQYEECTHIFVVLSKSSFINNEFEINTYILILKSYMKLSKPEEAKKIYKLMQRAHFNLISINLINDIAEIFYDINDFLFAGFIIKESEHKLKLTLNLKSYIILMKICLNNKNEEEMIEIYDKILLLNLSPHYEVFSILMRLFVSERKIIQAIGIYVDMKLNGFEIRKEDYEVIINLCFNNGWIDKGKEITKEAEKNGVIVGNFKLYNSNFNYPKKHYQ